MRRTTALRALIALGAALLALCMQAHPPRWDQRIGASLHDLFLRATASQQPEDRLVVVDIGEQDLERLGPWPWPRSRIADLLESLLGDYGARAVALDIVFPEAQPHDAAGEARLAGLARHAPLVLAQILDLQPRAALLDQGRPAGGRAAQDRPLPVAHGLIGNHPQLAAAARCAGNIAYQPDEDGVLRRIPLVTRFAGRDYLHLSASLIDCADPNPPAGRRFPATADGYWRIPYQRALSAYTVIPARAILDQSVPPQWLRDRYVLVGASALGLGDRVSLPLAALAPGVMVHAESLSALLDLAEGRLPPPRDARAGVLLWSLLSAALFVFWIAGRPAWQGALLLVGLAGAWLLLAFWGLHRQFSGSLTAPLWADLFLLLVAIPYEWRQSQRAIRRITETLAHYVARPVLDELLRQGAAYSLEPQHKEVTVLIADMAGYTRTTSALPLEAAARLTKEFLDSLTRPVLQHGGTLDKYTGDGLVAFWGAPLDCPEQADRALAAALDMFAEVARLNARRAAQGQPPIHLRIGIENGQALVGDLGTPFRSTYTAVGDCINFAARLEAAARDLPTPLVIGPSAQQKIRQHPTCPVGSLHLRGTDTVIDIFSVPPAELQRRHYPNGR